ncbi:MAG: replication-relaxation family protein [Chloroflexota bacterium]|nr:replication-relaxation family protein [Chloroflexota bacterium]
MMMHSATALDDGLQRDVAILSTLAHLHCATAQQLHALCFPYHTIATTRTTLYYLAEAHFLAHTPWRLKRESSERGQVWTLAAKGHDLLQRYVSNVPPLARIDLARPSTALEHEEWRIRLQVRTLLVRLLLVARQLPLLHAVAVELPWSASWPTAWGDVPLPDQDACLSVTWHPAERKAADWLPWLELPPTQATTMLHPIYLERAHARTNLASMLQAWSQNWPDRPLLPVVILQDEGRYAPTLQQLHTLPQAPSVRLCTLAALEGGLPQAQLRDEHGAACGLRPVSESTAA